MISPVLLLFIHRRWCTNAFDVRRVELCQYASITLIKSVIHTLFAVSVGHLDHWTLVSSSLPSFSASSFSLSGKTFWRRPKLWSRTQRCWCPVQPPVRTSCLRPPSRLPKPLPSSQMWSNWELPALALMTLRHRLARLVFLPSVSVHPLFTEPLIRKMKEWAVNDCNLSEFCLFPRLSCDKLESMSVSFSLGGFDKCCQRCGEGAGWAH